ncbi:acyl-CoA dehydrogenase family protein [Brevibacterium samyangense]|uniref:Acyl-CoA dehydrogenase family protein n=1 Tax=Brevibacterium samyangense TaxID=366888 RepID=A0ABN2T2K7_9MICO
MDFTTPEEHLALREAVRNICSEFGQDYYVERAEKREPTEEVWEALGTYGFIGINIPEEYGGGGAGMEELALVCEESAAAGTPLLLTLVSSAISGEVLSAYGTEEQKQRWLPPMAAGTDKVVFAITEPDAGSNSHKISTTARRDGDDWVLTGTKHFISGTDVAGALLVVTRTGVDEATGKAQLSLFLVDTDAVGLEKTPLPISIGLPEWQYILHFDNVRVPASALVGSEGDGLKQVFHGLNPERITGAAICVGIGRFALDKASRYGNERNVWGQPIGAHQGVAHPLAAAKVEIELAALMTQKAASLHSAGQPAGEASNMAKYAAAEAALHAIDATIQMHGGNGLATEFGLMPYWGLARLLRIAPINREMILNYVAQHSLGLPRSY